MGSGGTKLAGTSITHGQGMRSIFPRLLIAASLEICCVNAAKV